MVRLLAVLVGASTVVSGAFAADSVVLGHGVSNTFLSKLPCDHKKYICMDANYVWVLDADRTVADPSMLGRVRAIAVQHVDATEAFIKSVKIFVLRPIEDTKFRASSGAGYYLVALSPRYSDGCYCLAVKPNEVDLTLSPSQIVVNDTGAFCFDAKALKP
jgi:hypothetical protein